MKRGNTKVSLEDAERALTKPKGWWACLTCLFLAKRFSVFLVNKTTITANQVTAFSTFLSLCSALAFFCGPKFYWLGAIFYWSAYLFDCVDGTVARLKNQTTLYGGYFDAVSEYITQLMISIFFAHSYFRSTGDIRIYYYAILYCFFFMFFYWDGKFIKTTLNTPKVIKNSVRRGYFSFFDKRKIIAHPRRVEGSALIFVIGPITGHIMAFYGIGLIIIIVACLLKCWINFRRLLWPKKYDGFVIFIEQLKSESVKKIYIYYTDIVSFSALYSIFQKTSLINKTAGMISCEDPQILSFQVLTNINQISGQREGVKTVVPYLVNLGLEQFEKISDELGNKGLVIGSDFVGIAFEPYCKHIAYSYV